MLREKYIELINKVNSDPYRLHFHLMAPTGWLNDPNGLCVIKGVNHIYFQYTPFSATWGLKSWGHYSTENWIDYTEHPIFLRPSVAEDIDGVYSGSALVENNKIHYYYTGNVKYTDKKYDYILNGREQNVIEVISEDGFNYENKNILLKNSDYPQNMSTHVRDPKVFKVEDEYFMILSARTKEDIGCAILYKSLDLKKWEYFFEIHSEKKYGYMWECCDLIKIEDKWFLICCPQGVEQEGINFANIYQIGYFPIDINFKEKTYSLGEFIELDRGFDIYAPQTFVDNKGRNVLIAWMGIPDATYTNNKTIKNGWQHALSMPRTLKRKGNKILQEPLVEFENLRKNKISSTDNHIKFLASTFEMIIDIENSKNFLVKMEDVKLSYDNNIFSLEMQESGEGRNKRSVYLEELKKLHIFVDTSSIEIFINDGEEVFTSRFYPNKAKINIEVFNHGSCSYYDLDEFKIDVE